MTRVLLMCGLASLVVAGLSVSSCSSANGESAASGGAGGGQAAGVVSDGEWTDELSSADSEFAFALYERLRSRDGNIFFSPHSIYTALAMTYVGARGETERQMADALGLPGLGFQPDGRFTDEYRGRLAGAFGALASGLSSEDGDSTHTFAEANALWHQEGYGFLDPFLVLNRDGFGARASELDFAHDWEGARVTINEWVEERTRGKIENLIRPGDLDNLVRIVLTNAVYFKGLWEEQFDPGATRDAVFHARPGDPSGDVEVPTMRRKGEYRYARPESGDLALLELPYEGDGVSMLIVLPDEGLPGGLSSVEKILSADALEAWDSLMRSREVHVALPRFEMTWGTENIIPDLEAMGITDLFSDAADLSGMDGTRELYVSKVLHKAFVEVNEEGTEAAAATAVVGRLKAVMPLMFTVDRPFLFLIRDTGTGTVLFMGRVTDPTA